MPKKTILFVFVLLAFNAVNAQEVKKETKLVETKMDAFSSRTGTITKFIDSKLSPLKLSYGSSETRIRKIIVGTVPTFFFQIEKQGQYASSVASIEYSDLLEVIKALKTLKSDEQRDIEGNPDYLENKFTTVDGFRIGYYVDKGKSSWYLKLERYGSDNTLFVKNVEAIETAFNEAKSKIEELKK